MKIMYPSGARGREGERKEVEIDTETNEKGARQMKTGECNGHFNMCVCLLCW